MSWVSKVKLETFGKKFADKITELFVKKESGKGLSTNDFTTEEKNKLSGITAGAKPNVKSDWNVTDETSDAFIKNKPTSLPASDVAAWAKAAQKPSYTFGEIGSKPTTLSGYGITDAAAKKHTHSGDDITSIPASKITGMLDIDNIPPAALERCVTVTDDAARLALTSTDVQKGDTVKVTSTGLMYFVKDDTKLNSEAGYEQYTAGSAASVPWTGVTNKPSTFTPSAHTHKTSDLTDFAEITDAEIDAIIAAAFTE